MKLAEGLASMDVRVANIESVEAHIPQLST